MPPEEEPRPPEFVAYPRVEPAVRKDPDPIPADRWFARGTSLLCILSTLSSLTRGSVDTSGLGILVLGVMLIVLLAYFAAGRGYRAGFGVVMLFGLVQIWGFHLQWSRGMFFHGNWLTHLVNLFQASFALYCAARYFRLWPRRL